MYNEIGLFGLKFIHIPLFLISLTVFWLPPSIVIWLVGPLLGIVTLIISALDSETKDIWQLIHFVQYNKTYDLYLIAVVTSAVAAADAFELVGLSDNIGAKVYSPRERLFAKIAPKNFTVWTVLFFCNLLLLVCITILSTKISSLTCALSPHAALRTSACGDVYVSLAQGVWKYLFLSVSFGVMFRIGLELQHKN